MAEFGAVQPRKFLLDSSEENSRTAGNFKQYNNRYFCTLELTDYSVPVTIPAGAELSVSCWKNGDDNAVEYVLDKNSPDFGTIMNFTEGTNLITIDRWAAMVEHDGSMSIRVDINGMSSYTGTYNVTKDKRPKTRAYHPGQPVDGLAKSDLSNVLSRVFLAKAVAAGLMTNDMPGVNLDKLDEKFMATDSGKLLKSVVAATTPEALDRWLKQDPAFVALSQGQHPAVKGLTPAQIKALFFANRFEVTSNVDLTEPKYSTPKVLNMVYQLNSNDKVITQALPPVSSNQIILIEVVRASGVTGGKVIFTRRGTDLINGKNDPLEVAEDGYNGYLLPVLNENSWDYIHHSKTQPYSLSIFNEEGEVIDPVVDIKIEAPLTLSHDDLSHVTTIGLDQTRLKPTLGFMDGILNRSFVPNMVTSKDQTVRIAELPGQTDLDGNPSVVVDLSAQVKEIKDGVFATLGRNEDLNTNFPNQRPYFTPCWSKLGNYIGMDRDNKAWTVQDGGSDDPSVSGGTGMHIGAYLRFVGDPIASEDGYVEIRVVDAMTRDYIKNTNGQFMARRIRYRAGMKVKPEILVGAFMAKGQEHFAIEFDVSFPNQIFTIDPSTAMYIQECDTFTGTGIAELMFCQHTGITIHSGDRYYGTNWMNFAASLTGTAGFGSIPAGKKEMMGNGLFISTASGVDMEITGNVMTVKNTGDTPPVFEIGKLASPVESLELKLKTVAATLSLASKETDMELALMEWTGDGEPTLPILSSYSAGVPVFAAGWRKVSSKTMPVQVDGSVHSDSNAFTVPDGAKQFAIIAYPTANTSPMTVEFHDFEGDITPAFDRYDIATTFSSAELGLAENGYTYICETRALSPTAGLRYTLNDTDTKIPFGIIIGGGR